MINFISWKEFHILRINTEQNDFSILYLNIRSINFIVGSFNLIQPNSQSLYNLSNYKSIHQVRNYSKGSGLSIYMKKSFNFRACVCYFLSNFYFSPIDSPSKPSKCFLFHLKSSFRSRNIQIFVFLSSPVFFFVSHCLNGWSMKNLWCHQLSK